MKKSLKLAAAGLLAALSLSLVKPVRSWASQEGSYLYHAIFVNGPGVFYGASTGYKDAAGTTWTGLTVTTGTPTAAAPATLHFLGALGAKPATSTEGDFYYDIVQHTIAIATGTSTGNDKWLKANTATTGAAWTLY